MSVLPSLSVWSSVKFPFPKYSPDSKIIKPYSAESCDNFIQRNYEKSRAERASKMVNLRVPSSVSIDKENSVPNIYCDCNFIKKKSSKPKKKNRHIRFVSVPEIIFYEKESAISTETLSDYQNANFRCESDYSLGDKNEELKAGKFEEQHDEIGSIPSVKPWTLEELVEINRQKQEAQMKMEKRKNKMRESILRNRDRVIETSNEFFHPVENTIPKKSAQHDPFANFNEHYYCCDAYRSKLGLNTGYTEKVRLRGEKKK